MLTPPPPAFQQRLALIGIIREGCTVFFYPLNSKVPTKPLLSFPISFHGENYFTGPIIFATALSHFFCHGYGFSGLAAKSLFSLERQLEF